MTNQDCQSINLRTKKNNHAYKFLLFSGNKKLFTVTITVSVGILSLRCNFIRNRFNKCGFVSMIGLFFSVYLLQKKRLTTNWLQTDKRANDLNEKETRKRTLTEGLRTSTSLKAFPRKIK